MGVKLDVTESVEILAHVKRKHRHLNPSPAYVEWGALPDNHARSTEIMIDREDPEFCEAFALFVAERLT
jgi:hypothetical protein